MAIPIEELQQAVPPPEDVAKKLGLPGSSEFRVILSIMTIAEAAARRAPGFRDNACVLALYHDDYTGNLPRFNKAGKSEMVENIDLGTVTTVGETVANRDNLSSRWRVCILDKDKLKLSPPQRQCNLEQCVSKALLGTLKLAPENETVRGHIMAMFGKLPPPEAKTFDEVKDWIEFNCYPLQLAGPMKQAYRADTGGDPVPTEAVLTGGQVLAELRVNASESVFGRCRYSARRRWSEDMALTEDHMLRIIQQAERQRGGGGGEITMRNVLDAATSVIKELAREVDENAEHDNWDYEDHDQTNARDYRVDFNNDELALAVENYLRRHYGEEQAQEIIER